MAKPLRLFVNPSSWIVVHTYGWEDPPPATGKVFHTVLTLQTAGEGTFFAAGAGKLSVLPPGSGWLDAREPVPLLEPGQPLPNSVNLYLHLSPFTSANALFSSRADQLFNIAGFVYLNVEMASLSVTLKDQLRLALFPASSGVTDQHVAELLIAGMTGVPVSSGDKIGKASTVGAAAGSRQLGFGVISDCGPIDPSYAYDWMRDFVAEGQPAVDDFLRFVPKKWPIIDPNLTQTEAIDQTAADLYLFSVLEELRNRNPPLSQVQRRWVGDNQKALWRKRLLSRTGHALPAGTDPPFEFNDIDYRNLFQLEALVEFFANYPRPWAAGEVPRERVASTITGTAATVSGNVVNLGGSPDLSTVTPQRDEIFFAAAEPPRILRITAIGPSSVTVCGEPVLASGTSAWEIRILNPDYIDVDFLDPAGGAATVDRQVVTLDGCSDLTRINSDKDTLWLANAADGEPDTYRITAVDAIGRTVTLAVAPVLDGASSAWRVNLRPTLVLVDSFGARIKGKAATIQTPEAQSILHLADAASADLKKVNRNFDTIYLPADGAGAKRAYRITARDFTALTVTVDGSPVFADGKSDWHIQAGVSGDLPGTEGALGPGGEAGGYDHYDGTLFVVNGSRVVNRFRWSSFTSRASTGNEESSIRGNRLYRYATERAATKAWINFAFRVQNAVGAIDPQPAAFYFRTPPTANTKGAIFIHNGSANSTSGTGSGGCLVSPSFYDLRDLMIQLDREERDSLQEALGGGVDVLACQGRTASETLYSSGAPNQPGWNGKLVGALWLIRPDELPVNP